MRALASASGHPLDAKKKSGGSGAIVAVGVALGLILPAVLAGLWLPRSNASAAP